MNTAHNVTTDAWSLHCQMSKISEIYDLRSINCLKESNIPEVSSILAAAQISSATSYIVDSIGLWYIIVLAAPNRQKTNA